MEIKSGTVHVLQKRNRDDGTMIVPEPSENSDVSSHLSFRLLHQLGKIMKVSLYRRPFISTSITVFLPARNAKIRSSQKMAGSYALQTFLLYVHTAEHKPRNLRCFPNLLDIFFPAQGNPSCPDGIDRGSDEFLAIIPNSNNKLINSCNGGAEQISTSIS